MKRNLTILVGLLQIVPLSPDPVWARATLSQASSPSDAGFSSQALCPIPPDGSGVRISPKPMINGSRLAAKEVENQQLAETFTIRGYLLTMLKGLTFLPREFSERDRTILEAFYLEGQRFKTIAAILGITPGAAKARKNRAFWSLLDNWPDSEGIWESVLAKNLKFLRKSLKSAWFEDWQMSFDSWMQNPSGPLPPDVSFQHWRQSETATRFLAEFGIKVPHAGAGYVVPVVSSQGFALEIRKNDAKRRSRRFLVADPNGKQYHPAPRVDASDAKEAQQELANQRRRWFDGWHASLEAWRSQPQGPLPPAISLSDWRRSADATQFLREFHVPLPPFTNGTVVPVLDPYGLVLEFWKNGSRNPSRRFLLADPDGKRILPAAITNPYFRHGIGIDGAVLAIFRMAFGFGPIDLNSLTLNVVHKIDRNVIRNQVKWFRWEGDQWRHWQIPLPKTYRPSTILADLSKIQAAGNPKEIILRDPIHREPILSVTVEIAEPNIVVRVQPAFLRGGA